MSAEQLIFSGFARVRGSFSAPEWPACRAPHPDLARIKCQRYYGHHGNHIKYRTGTAEPEHEWTTTT